MECVKDYSPSYGSAYPSVVSRRRQSSILLKGDRTAFLERTYSLLCESLNESTTVLMMTLNVEKMFKTVVIGGRT
jgi:hypothetical protein